MKILSVEDISYTVFPPGNKELQILKNISFTLNKNSVLGVSGESGSGKTTLGKIIAGHLKPTSGKVILNAASVNKSNPVQLLFQNTGSILNPLRRIDEIISEAALVHFKDAKLASDESENLLRMLDLREDLWRKRGYELSGGEQQRAALARILAVKPQLLILDEPFAAQDVQSQLNILNLLKKIKEDFKLTVICISHNQKILDHIADSIIKLKNGEIFNSQLIGEVKQQ